MTGRTKFVLGTLAVVVIGTVAVTALGSGRGGGTSVRVETVERRDLVARVTASGNIRARRQVDLSSDISARVATLYVVEGQDVEEGEILLELDRTQLEAILSRAQAVLSQSRAQASQQEANLLRARREYERVTGLEARDPLLVSRQQVEDAETNLQVAEANLEAAVYAVRQAEAGVEEAQDQLDRTVFRAPIDGKVIRLNVDEGETVVVGTMNNPGSLILSIADLSVVEAVVQVDETDVPLLTLGDSAEIEIDAFPNQVFKGRVTEIGNSAIQSPTQQTNAQQAAIDFEVVLTLDSTEVELRPDLSATADIITDTREDALSVPIIAVTLRESKDDTGQGDPSDEVEGVFLAEGGVARFRPVRVGIAGDEYFEVVDGLREGDTVVAGPYQVIRQLADGDPIQTGGDLPAAGPEA